MIFNMKQPEVYIEVIGDKAYVKEKGTNKTLGYWQDKTFTPYNKEIINVEFKVISEEKEEPEVICGKCNMKLTKDNHCGCGEKSE